MLSVLPPHGHLTHFMKSLVLVLQLCPQQRIFSHTPRHKWTRLIDFLSSREYGRQFQLVVRPQGQSGEADGELWLGVPQQGARLHYTK